MFDLEKALAAWRRTLEHNPSFLSDDIEELERHLRDQVSALRDQGWDVERAYRHALAEMGPYGATEAEYRKVFWRKARRRSALAAVLGVRVQLWKAYFKLAYRNLLKDKLSSAINIVGFGAAIACCLVVFVFIHLQYNLDTFHEGADRIFQVQQVLAEPVGGRQRLGLTPMPLGPALTSGFPQVEHAVRIQPGQATVQAEGGQFEERLLFVDPEFLKLFTFPLDEGTREALAIRRSLVLSGALAVKFFGEQDPLGRVLTLTFEEQHTAEFVVGGVAAAFPNNSSFAFDLLVPYAQLEALGLADPGGWSTPTQATFVRLHDATDAPSLASGLGPFVEARNAARASLEDEALPTTAFYLENLRVLSLSEEEVLGAFVGGSSRGENLFMIVLGLIIILLASTNYINIAIVSAARRLKEIGVRKVVGGSRRQLVGQFLVENVLLCLLALCGGVALAHWVLLPGFNALFPKHAPTFDMDLAGSPTLWGFMLLLVLSVALLSGAYPALYVARFQPVVIFRGKLQLGGRNRFIRGLLVFQLVVTFIALVLPVADAQHDRRLAGRDWGYEASDLAVVPVPGGQSYAVLLNALAQHPDVVRVAGARHHIGGGQGTAMLQVDGREHRVLYYDVGPEYPETMGLRLKQGRFFDPLLGADRDRSIIVNEALVRQMGWAAPLGQGVVFNGQSYEVVGVVEDFLRRVWADTEPHFFRLSPEEGFRYLVVQARPGRVTSVAGFLQAQWAQLHPSAAYEGFYQADVFQDNDPDPFGFIGFLTLLLSCMGNLGLVALHIARRRKEISVRKVLGASAPGIARLVVQTFLRPLFLALLLALPLAYILLGKVMDERVLEAQVGPMPYLLAAALMAATMLLTVAAQIARAVATNPVEGLRTE